MAEVSRKDLSNSTEAFSVKREKKLNLFNNATEIVENIFLAGKPDLVGRSGSTTAPCGTEVLLWNEP